MAIFGASPMWSRRRPRSAINQRSAGSRADLFRHFQIVSNICESPQSNFSDCSSRFSSSREITLVKAQVFRGKLPLTVEIRGNLYWCDDLYPAFASRTTPWNLPVVYWPADRAWCADTFYGVRPGLSWRWNTLGRVELRSDFMN